VVAEIKQAGGEAIASTLSNAEPANADKLSIANRARTGEVGWRV
jgi:hypothetical protein